MSFIWKKSFAYGSLLLLFVVMLSSLSVSQEYSVGVSPPKIDLGDVLPGMQKLVSFFIVTPSDKTILVSLEREPDRLDMAVSRFGPLMPNYSEQDSYGWVQLITTPVELKPVSEALSTAAGMIKGWREVNFILDVPKDAESGYHSFYIKPVPITPSEQAGQVGARLVAVTPILVYFRIPDAAIRSGDILDITQDSSVRDSTAIDIQFLNTGNTTISATGSIVIYDENGTFMASGETASLKLKPGQIQSLQARLPNDMISPSQYKVSANVSYITGMASKTMFLPLSVPAQIGKIKVITPEAYLPTWAAIAAILIIIMIAIYYSRRRGRWGR